MAIDEFPKLRDYDWHGRLMFGTDLPVWQAKERVGLTRRYREYVRAFRETGLEAASNTAFMSFVCAGGKRLMMDVGQEIKMNTDDEWISIDKIIRDVNRDMKLADEAERCQELNATFNQTNQNTKQRERKINGQERCC